MVCSRCTLLHSTPALVCSQCGQPLRGAVERSFGVALQHVPSTIGVLSGGSLLACLIAALVAPVVATQALAVGSYFGIASITNVWLSVYRDEAGESLRGARGVAYSCALLFALIAELARVQHLQSLPLPGGSVPTPPAMTIELLALVLIVLDPLVVTPFVHWIEGGVVRGSVERDAG